MISNKGVINMDEKIDFVVTWVDGSDPEWLAEKSKYTNISDNSINRYKDWGLLKYWFRGVEKFAPWVNKIYFITWGHLPEWLDTTNPKLVIVNHKDYIPKEYLPTYNSNVIELNINRIKELSEHFVLFNDDTFLINNTKPTDFFVNGNPCDTVALSVHCPKKSAIIQTIANNNVSIINEHFDFRKSIKQNFGKWFNLKNGSLIFRTLALLNCPRFPGFYQSHLPASHKKSVFDEVWKAETEIMELTSHNRFRKSDEVNHWMMKAWYIAQGNVHVRSPKFGKVFYIREYSKKLYDCLLNYINHQKVKCICINDSDSTDEYFEKAIPEIINCFEHILPEKSKFEK